MSGFTAEIDVSANVDSAIGPLTQVAEVMERIADASKRAAEAQESLGTALGAAMASWLRAIGNQQVLKAALAAAEQGAE